MSKTAIPEFVRAVTLDEALGCLASGPYVLLCGGTDFYPSRAGRPVDEPILDISGIAALHRIEAIADGWRIGAAATWSEILRAPLPPAFSALQAAAREIGGVQIQNTGSIGGNVCNASPAADGVVPLLALDTRVILRSVSGERELALADFLLGSRKTALRANEIVTAFDVPLYSPRARSTFQKLGNRRYLVISIAMAACLIDRDASGRITGAAVAVGSCSASARRMRKLEARLAGKPAGEDLAALLDESDLDVLTPIDDLRGTRVYRHAAVMTLLRRSLKELSA
ncbi:MAG: FAD binding domain-containing protein [Burkholderiaceae bacterium]